ncbi:MAG: ABC transporter permease subunit [Oscillospiraceae bacterium]|jgi:glycine betaine/proline transport system permease protein/glycine betaine/proline transport system substrate-binding protein|nr:ABC transporter permease subunit [Oscillospiraceae bacterium]
MPAWLFDFPDALYLNIKTPIDSAIKYMLVNWNSFFDGLSRGLGGFLNGVAAAVNLIPWWLLLAGVFIVSLRTTKKLGRALLYTALLAFVGVIGLWALMYQTLAIVITSVLISLLLGLPIGVLISSGDKANTIIRPILDTMQTMPSFVYLIPAAMLLGLGNVPAVIATTIYAVPPVIRLTSLGIRQVDTEVVEAAKAFGATRAQALFKVQIPQAMPTIMTGINQTIMMAISMVVTCSMIGATGLGAEVITGINRLESGRGFAAGISIVIVAIIMDRLTQGMFRKERDTRDE